MTDNFTIHFTVTHLILASLWCFGFWKAFDDGMIFEKADRWARGYTTSTPGDVRKVPGHMPNWLYKPLMGCVICMASIWGFGFYVVVVGLDWGGMPVHTRPFRAEFFVESSCEGMSGTERTGSIEIMVSEEEKQRRIEWVKAQTNTWLKRYARSQGQPIRFLYNGWGLTIWKWAACWCPTWLLHFGTRPSGTTRYMGYNIFHNGFGFEIFFPGVLIFRIATKDRIGWWLKRKIQWSILDRWHFGYEQVE